MADSIFTGLEPAGIWQHFEAITHIARPSRHEDQMVAYILDWAKARGFEHRRDQAGNLVVVVPASAGRESAPVIVLQSHLDMVCERNADSPYDAEVGRIHPVREGEWIVADGTTLGADNGIGVATNLAVGQATDIPHGPLELLFTLDEETGLTGAKNLDASILQGRTLLNLDSEDDGVLYVGCAGGSDTRILWSRPLQPADGTPFQVSVSGLQGGHSGVDIHKNRLNAIHAVARLLQSAAGSIPVALCHWTGGNKRNAIPRESQAIVVVPTKKAAAFRRAIEKTEETLRAQYRGLEDGLQISVSETTNSGTAFTIEDTNRLLNLVRALPTGPIAMSQDIPGLVETSSNLAVITTKIGQVEIINSSRSSVAGAMRDTLDTLHAITELAGAQIKEEEDYPGWKPDLTSPVLKLTRKAYEKLFGKEPHVTAVHAGLECGILGERVPGLDMVSFGPQISGAHAPGERVHIPSVGRFWKLLAAVLDDLSSGL